MIVSGAVGVAAVVGIVAVWPDSPAHHGPRKVIRVAAPPVRPALATPHPLAPRLRAKQGPLSTTAPTAGTGLGAPDHLSGHPGPFQVMLSWRRVSGAVGYLVFRDGVQVGQTTGLTFDDTALRPGVPHTWTVAAVDRANNPGDRSAPYTAASATR